MTDLVCEVRARLIQLADEIAGLAIRDPSRDPRVPRAVHALHQIADTLSPPASSAPKRDTMRRAAPLAALITPLELARGPAAPAAGESQRVSQRESGQSGSGPRDDLTCIRGIDPELAAGLTGLGVETFAGIANWRADDVKRIGAVLDVRRRISRENWIEQAALLAAKAAAKVPTQPGALAIVSPDPAKLDAVACEMEAPAPSIPMVESHPPVSEPILLDGEEAEVAILPRSGQAERPSPPPAWSPVAAIVSKRPSTPESESPWEEETGAALVTIIRGDTDPRAREPRNGRMPAGRLEGPDDEVMIARQQPETGDTLRRPLSRLREGIPVSFSRFLDGLRGRGG